MKNRRLEVFLPLALSLLAALGGAGGQDVEAGQSAGEPAAVWNPERMMALPVVTGVAPSPDGKHVAYTVRRAEMSPGRSEYLSRLTVARTDGGAARVFDQGAASASD